MLPRCCCWRTALKVFWQLPREETARHATATSVTPAEAITLLPQWERRLSSLSPFSWSLFPLLYVSRWVRRTGWFQGLAVGDDVCGDQSCWTTCSGSGWGLTWEVQVKSRSVHTATKMQSVCVGRFNSNFLYHFQHDFEKWGSREVRLSSLNCLNQGCQTWGSGPRKGRQRLQSVLENVKESINVQLCRTVSKLL